MNETDHPKRRILLHVGLLLVGVLVLFYLCFARETFGFKPTFHVRMIMVVAAIMGFGFYLRRFGRSSEA